MYIKNHILPNQKLIFILTCYTITKYTPIKFKLNFSKTENGPTFWNWLDDDFCYITMKKNFNFFSKILLSQGSVPEVPYLS